MDKTGWIVCKAFLQKCAPERRSALLKYFPARDIEAMQNLVDTAGDPIRGIAPPDEELGYIHYSWLAPFLRTLPESEIRLFLSSLEEPQLKGLKKLLLFSNHLAPLNPLAKTFLRQWLFNKLIEDREPLLPPNCLPQSPLNSLLDLHGDQLILLIDFLGIHDLAIEIRHIIDNAKLKLIYSALSKDEHLYLKNLLQQKAAVTFKRMGLGKWNGEKAALRNILQQRGINRLAKALFGQNDSLVWYVTHQFEAERGELLQKLCVELEHPRAKEALVQQVMELIPNIQNIKKTT